VAGILEDNAQGWKIVQNMNSWPEKWSFEDNLSAKGISLWYSTSKPEMGLFIIL